MEQLGDKYKGQAAFLFIYGQEAHPLDVEGASGPADRPLIKQAKTMAERHEAAKTFQSQRNIRRRILLDGFGADSYWERLFYDRQNPLLVVDAQGRITAIWNWADPQELDLFLSRFLTPRGVNSEQDGEGTNLP